MSKILLGNVEGPPGPQGPKGDKGDTGATGPQGNPGTGSVQSVNNILPDGAGNVTIEALAPNGDGSALTGITASQVGADVSGAAAAAQAASLQKSANLSDLVSAGTARTNLGLGTAATHPATDFDASGSAAAAQTNAEAYTDTETTRAEAAEALLAPLASPALTGNPTAPTQSAGNNSTRLATTAYADNSATTAASGKINRSGDTMTGYLAPDVTTLAFVGSGNTLVNAALGNSFNLTLTASTTTLGNPSNSVDGQVIRFRITQGSGGPFTLAYASAYDFGAAGAPALSTVAGKVDILGFEYVASISKWCYLGSGLGF